MVYAQNKYARFEHEIMETLEAGIVLSGPEVKAIRGGHMQLKAAFVTFSRDEAYLTNAHISKYKHAAEGETYDPEHSRKLLLKKKEIAYLQGKRQEKGLTIIPLSVYTKGRHIKIEIAVARGKKLHDKRRTLKDRAIKREIEQKLKGG